MVLDTLEILIEADKSGLESQLKRASSSITQFVNSMNKQEVSWTQILSKNITPALIAGIASTFAIAVTQALDFQNQMQTSSLSAKDSFSTNTAKMSDSVYDMSANTGQSASEIANAMGIVQQSFKDTAAAQGILNVVSQEAYIRNQNVADTAKQLVPLFNEWGITSGPEASHAMSILNEAVKEGRISFEDLVSGLTDAGPALRQYTDLASAAGQTELFSALPGMDANTALQALRATVTDIQQPLSQASVLMGNLANKVKDGGMAEAFEVIAAKIKSAGALSNEFYGALGLDNNAMSILKQTSADAIKTIADGYDKLKEKSVSLDQSVIDNTTLTKELKQAWATFNADIQKFIVPGGLIELISVLTILDGLLKLITGTFKDTSAFFNELFSSKNTEDVLNALGGSLKNQTTPSTVGIDSRMILPNSSARDTPNKNSSEGFFNGPIYNITTNVNSPTGDPAIVGNKLGTTIKDYIEN